VTRQIDLVWLGSATSAPSWSVGKVWTAQPTPSAVNQLIQQQLIPSNPFAVLFWHPDVGQPDATVIQQAAGLPGDVWHAGLRLGMGGLPGLLDFVSSTWMLNCDPAPTIEATSWRMSLKACLIQTEALRQLGGAHPDFRTLEAAAAEMGHRYISLGVLPRHIPWLIQTDQLPQPITIPFEVIPFEDELRFMRYRFSRFWVGWAVLRAIASGYVRPRTALQAWSRTRTIRQPGEAKPYQHMGQSAETPGAAPLTVTALIPTVDRYPYLRKLLGQLRQQTIAPCEIIIIDQTEPSRRDSTLVSDFPDLPIQLIYLVQAGQCSSRNAGLQIAKGDCILFVDDDDEIPSDLIENHLRTLDSFQVDVSSGVAHEIGAGPLPKNFTYMRASDVFPTNNTLIRRQVLEQTGLFDLAYERMPRADGDLGMRVYLSGKLMLLNPAITVLHHHAPSGGLRKHKARVITYASSRQSLIQRQLPSISELYLVLRYFTQRQVTAGLWLSAFGTFAVRGDKRRKLVKLLIGLILLPDTIQRLRTAYKAARDMLRDYPQIPRLGE